MQTKLCTIYREITVNVSKAVFKVDRGYLLNDIHDQIDKLRVKKLHEKVTELTINFWR